MLDVFLATYYRKQQKFHGTKLSRFSIKRESFPTNFGLWHFLNTFVRRRRHVARNYRRSHALKNKFLCVFVLENHGFLIKILEN